MQSQSVGDHAACNHAGYKADYLCSHGYDAFEVTAQSGSSK